MSTKLKNGKIRLGIFQFTPLEAKPEENLKRVEGEIEKLSRKGVDIVLLPELWATGQISRPDETLCKKTDDILFALKTLAHTCNIIIVGSLPEWIENDEDHRLYNTNYVIGPGDIFHSYRKIHLFGPMGEDKIFNPGSTPFYQWIDINGTEVGLGLMTCFDLRFPELSREMVFQGIDLLLVSALWPKARKNHFTTLLQARAIENQCFIGGANAWGVIAGTEFGGGSRIIDPRGEILAMADDGENIIISDIELDRIKKTRDTFFTAHPPRDWFGPSNKKIVTLDVLTGIAQKRRKAGQKMVFTNGCFDLLHAGHVSYLEAARKMGDYLVVGLNSDRSVSNLKGPSRPVNNERMRASVLAGLESVDYVVIFDTPTPHEIISTLTPDILVKGADWDPDKIVGADVVKGHGGVVKCIPFVHDISTTHVINKIIRSHR